MLLETVSCSPFQAVHVNAQMFRMRSLSVGAKRVDCHRPARPSPMRQAFFFGILATNPAKPFEGSLAIRHHIGCEEGL